MAGTVQEEWERSVLRSALESEASPLQVFGLLSSLSPSSPFLSRDLGTHNVVALSTCLLKLANIKVAASHRSVVGVELLLCFLLCVCVCVCVCVRFFLFVFHYLVFIVLFFSLWTASARLELFSSRSLLILPCWSECLWVPTDMNKCF